MARKRVLAAVLLSIALSMQTGCSAISGMTNTNENTGTRQEDKKDSQKNVMKEFDALLEKNPKLTELAGFVKENISKADTDTAAKMILEFEKQQKAYLSKLEEKYFEGESVQTQLMKVFNGAIDLNKIDGISDNGVKELLSETIESGYKVETAEGTYFPIINYSFYKEFGAFATEDIKEYIEIMAAESDRVPAKDAALVIPWEEIIKRALNQEKFINKHGTSSKIEEVKQLYNKYVTFTLFGANNTPLFSYDNKEMNLDAKKAYLEAAAQKESSDYLKLIRDYLELLKKNNYKLTNDVDQFRKK